MQKNKNFFYGLGNLGYGVVSQTFTNFIMFFGTGVLRISGTTMGVIIAITTLWDGFNDPFVGYLSDRFKNRHRFIVFGFVGMSIANMLVWCVPNTSIVFKCIWLLLSMMMLETFNTCFHVPYSALSTELDSGTILERQKYKSIFFIVSMAAPSIFMILFFQNGNYIMEQSSYIIIGAICSIICLVCGVLSYIKTKGQLIRAFSKKAETTFGQSCKELVKSILLFFTSFKNKNYAIIIIGACLSLVICGFVTTMGIHVFKYSFEYSSTMIYLLIFILILFSVIGQFVWTNVSNKTSEKYSLIYGELLTACFLILLLINYYNVFGLSIVASFSMSCVLVAGVGFSSTVLYSIPFSIFNKIVMANNNANKRMDTASHTGMLMLSYQVFNAISCALLGVFLDCVGFNAELNIQNIFVRDSISKMLLLGLIIIFVICAILHSFLDNDFQNKDNM